MSKMYDVVVDRLAKLDDAGFQLEMVLVFSQTLENLIKLYLAGQASKRRMLKILGARDPYDSINLDHADDAPLGSLIGTLKKFTGKTILIEQLSRFNLNLRTEVIHHIFNGQKDIALLEKKIQNEFSDKDNVWTAVEALAEMVSKVDEEIKELSKED